MYIENLLRKIEFKGKRRLVRKIFDARTGIVNHSKSKLYFDTFELIGFEMYWCGGYEKEVTWIYEHIINSNYICLDIGANIGVHTIILCEKSQHVHAFEPHPIFRKKLKDNLELNNFVNVTIHSSGVSNYVGTATLHAPPPEMNNKSATICDINDELTEKIEIEITELDKIEDKTSRFQFMKIDCDGSDAAIILGGKNILQKYKPIILFEDMSWFLSKDLRDGNKIANQYANAYDFLRSIEYDIYGIRNKYLVRLEGRPIGYENVLAVHSADKCNITARSLSKNC